MKKSKYKRWVTISGHKEFGITGLIKIALDKGLSITFAGKVGICMWYELGLHGTMKQMESFEKFFDVNKIEYFNRMPRGAWQFNHNPRGKWITNLEDLD